MLFWITFVTWQVANGVVCWWKGFETNQVSGQSSSGPTASAGKYVWAHCISRKVCLGTLASLRKCRTQWTLPVCLDFRDKVATYRKQTSQSGHIGLRSIHSAAEPGLCWPIHWSQISQRGVEDEDELLEMQDANTANRRTLGWCTEAHRDKSTARCGALGGAATSPAPGVSVTRVNITSTRRQCHMGQYGISGKPKTCGGIMFLNNKVQLLFKISCWCLIIIINRICGPVIYNSVCVRACARVCAWHADLFQIINLVLYLIPTPDVYTRSIILVRYQPQVGSLVTSGSYISKQLSVLFEMIVLFPGQFKILLNAYYLNTHRNSPD